MVSVLGLLVNLVGVYAFQHGHSHGGGSSHGHSHGGASSHGHSHNNHSHDHSIEMDNEGPNSQIMKGVFLHILADTLGKDEKYFSPS